MTISQNEIEPEAGRTVANKGFYAQPYNCTQQMTTVRFVGAVKPKSCGRWFDLCEKLTEVKNIENLYLPAFTHGMFWGCESLKNLDLSHVDTSNVTNMCCMFYCCYSLTSLDLSNFDARNVNNMVSMFAGCESLTSLDLSSLDTSKVKYMSNMFNCCYSLTSLDLSNFDISKAIEMSSMFENCPLLQDKSDDVKFFL